MRTAITNMFMSKLDLVLQTGKETGAWANRTWEVELGSTPALLTGDSHCKRSCCAASTSSPVEGQLCPAATCRVEQ